MTNPTGDDQGAPTADAPEAAARPAVGARARRRALLAFVACASLLGTMGAYAWRHRVDASRLDSAPFRLDGALLGEVRSAVGARDPLCAKATPIVILYVTRECLHCRAELERWARLERERADAIHCVAVTVASARAVAATSDWPPREFAQSLYWDRDGALGRALDVRLVPLAAYVTREGVVMARVIGESAESSTNAHLADLRRASGAMTEGH